MIWIVDEMAVDDMAVDDMAVDDMAVDEMAVDDNYPRRFFCLFFRSGEKLIVAPKERQPKIRLN